MNRRVATLGLIVAVTCFSLAWCVPIDRAAEEKAAAAEGFTPKKLIAQLHKRIDLAAGIDAGTPFAGPGGALEILAGKIELPIHLDEKAFKNLDPAFNVVEQTVVLPPLKGVRISTILSMLLAQIRMENGYGATYLVRGEMIEVTTTYQALTELVGTEIPTEEPKPKAAAAAGADAPAFDEAAGLPAELRAVGSSRRLGLPIIHADFDQKSLRDVLAELAESTGQTIILDPRVADRAKNAVTATFANALLDSVLELAVTGSDLTVVRIDGMFYVTTPENAEKLQKRRGPHSYQGKPAKVGGSTGPTPVG